MKIISLIFCLFFATYLPIQGMEPTPRVRAITENPDSPCVIEMESGVSVVPASVSDQIAAQKTTQREIAELLTLRSILWENVDTSGVSVKAIEPTTPTITGSADSLLHIKEMQSVSPVQTGQQNATKKTKKMKKILTFIPRNKRTTTKTVLWESVFAVGLSVLTFEVASSFQVDPKMAIAAAYLNQVLEAPFYWTYEYLWKRYWPSKFLNKSATITHLDQATGPASSSDASGNPSPEDMV